MKKHDNVLVMACNGFVSYGEQLAQLIGANFVQPFQVHFATGEPSLSLPFSAQEEEKLRQYDYIIVVGSTPSGTNKGDSQTTADNIVSLTAFAKDIACQVRPGNPARVFACIGNLPYMRAHDSVYQDKSGRVIKDRRAASFLLDMLAPHRADKIFSFDIHCPELVTELMQKEVIAADSVVNLSFTELIAEKIDHRLQLNTLPLALVLPDQGSWLRYGEFAAKHNIPQDKVYYVNKKRTLSGPIANFEVGFDRLAGHLVIFLDDMFDTGGTLTNLAQLAKEKKAEKVVVIVTHFLGNGPALLNLQLSQIDHLFATNTVPITNLAGRVKTLIEVQSHIELLVPHLLAEIA